MALLGCHEAKQKTIVVMNFCPLTFCFGARWHNRICRGVINMVKHVKTSELSGDVNCDNDNRLLYVA